MRDWAQISELYIEFRDSELRTNTRVKLSAILDAPAGDDLIEVHAKLRRLLREDVEAVLGDLGLRDRRILTWFDDDERAMYSLSLEKELERLAGAPVLDSRKRAKLERYLEGLRPPSPTMQPALDAIVPPSRQWIGDGESVDAAGDYEPIVIELLALAEVEARVECIEPTRGKRQLTVRVGKRTARAELRGDSDWIDPPPLIACLNEVLPKTAARHFHQVTLPEWGQELGIVLASKAEYAKLYKAKLLEEASYDDDD